MTSDVNVKTLLHDAGLRPTRQRMDLGRLLFDGEDRHFTAEMLHEEAVCADVPVSLATVYNTLHQFTEAGLLREVAVSGAKTYFDTNTGDHHHFHVEGTNTIIDIDTAHLEVQGLPVPPDGMEVSQIDVVIHLRRAKSS